MSEERYDIVFKGELVRSYQPDDVKKNIGRLFKVGGAKLDALFSGKAVVLKRNLDFDAATKYRVAIKKAGARVDLVLVAPQDVPASSSVQPPVDDTPAQAVEAPAAQLPDQGAFSLAPAGADLNPDRPEVPANDIDTSAISLKAPGEDLLNANEKASIPDTPVTLQTWDVAPAGEDLLRHDERRVDAPVQVDTEGLSVSAPGARLSEPAPPPPPPPDTSGLDLASEE